jgi:hypothetical protein
MSVTISSKLISVGLQDFKSLIGGSFSKFSCTSIKPLDLSHKYLYKGSSLIYKNIYIIKNSFVSFTKQCYIYFTNSFFPLPLDAITSALNGTSKLCKS